MRGHVEGGVVDVAAARGHQGPVAPARHAAHLLRRALLNDNLRAVVERAVERGLRRRHIERHVVVMREHGQPVRADLVGEVTVGADAVCPHDDRVHHALLHERAGHGVADERVRHARLPELPRGQAGALGYGPRLVDPYFLDDAALECLVDHRKRRTVAHRAKRAGVAVRLHAQRAAEFVRQALEDSSAVHTDDAAGEFVLVGHLAGARLHFAHGVFDVAALFNSLFRALVDLVDAPCQVHRRRPHRLHTLGNGRELCLEGNDALAIPFVERPQHQRKAGGHANGRRPAHRQVRNAAAHVSGREAIHIHERMRQLDLVNERKVGRLVFRSFGP